MKKAATITTSLLGMAMFIVMGMALTACGGSDGSNAAAPVSGSISGVAATGDAISDGLVTLKCASGLSSVTSTTNADGSYRFTVDKITLPCLVQVSYTDAAGTTQTLHAYVSGTGTTNITPLSDLLLATLLSTPALDPAFASFNNTPLRPFSTHEQTDAWALLTSRLLALGITLPPNVDPVHNSLIAKTVTQEGNALDQLLDELSDAMQTHGASQFQTRLIVTLGMPIDAAVHYSQTVMTPTQENLTALAQSLSTYGMTGTHTGTLAGSATNCSFTIESSGNITIDFAPPYLPPSLYVQGSPMADGIDISLNLSLPGLGISYIDNGAGPLHSFTWNLLDTGNGLLPSSISNFFQITGASGARSAILHYNVRTVAESPGVVTQYFRQRALEITVPTSSLSQSGSVTCVTPEHSFIPV